MSTQTSWRTLVDPILRGWSEPHKTSMYERLADENDMAESLGFSCKLDEHRGFGYCSFEKRQGDVLIKVFETRDGWTRGEQRINASSAIKNRLFFHTLRDALINSNPRAATTRYGEIKPVAISATGT